MSGSKFGPAIRRSTVAIERDEDGVFSARVPSLEGCHTYAETWDELPGRPREVIVLCLEERT